MRPANRRDLTAPLASTNLRLGKGAAEMGWSRVVDGSQRRLAAGAAALACLWAGLAQAAAPLKEVALVIGNGAYQNGLPVLKNPVSDAQLVGRALQSLGFTLVGGAVKTDLDRAGMIQAISDLDDAAQGADVVVVYYAGHGVQVGSRNFLIPVDMVQPKTDTILAADAVGLDTVLDEFARLPASKINILMLDACRDSPIQANPTRGLTPVGGLAYVPASGANVIWFATQPGQVAQDGGGANGPYAQSVSATLRETGLPTGVFFDHFGTLLKQITNAQQVPAASANPSPVEFVFNADGAHGAFSEPAPGGGILAAEAGAGQGSGRSLNGDEPPAQPDPQQPQQQPDPSANPLALRTGKLARAFGSGLRITAGNEVRDFSWGLPPAAVEKLLAAPEYSWEGLARAEEYKGDDVRYLWAPLNRFPTLATAFSHMGLRFHCIDANASELVFFFKNARLFHISMRFNKTDSCPDYGWMRPVLMGPLGDKVTFNTAAGRTDLVLNDIPEAMIIEVIQQGIADEDASLFKGSTPQN